MLQGIARILELFSLSKHGNLDSESLQIYLGENTGSGANQVSFYCSDPLQLWVQEMKRHKRVQEMKQQCAIHCTMGFREVSVL